MANWYRQAPATITKAMWLADTIKCTLHTPSYTPNYDTDGFVSALSNEVANGLGYTTGGVTLTNKSAIYLTAAVTAVSTSWGNAPVVSTAYVLGSMMQTGGNLHRCITAGTSAGTAPTWATTVGSTTTDGTATWMCEGAGTMTSATSTAYGVGVIIRPASANGFLYRATVGGTSASSAPTWPTTVGQTVADGSVTWENIGAGMTVFAAANPSWASATFLNARYPVISDRTPGTAATQPLIGISDYGSGQNGTGATFTHPFNPQGALFLVAA